MRRWFEPRGTALATTLLLLGGCTDTTPTQRLPVPTLSRPTIGATPATVPRGDPAQPSPTIDLRARYPLTLAEALNFVGLNYAVAGYFQNGEIRVQKLQSTEWEQRPVTEQVCKDRWDSMEGKYKYSCKFETINKRQRVLKTKFWVSGSGVHTVPYETVHQAFANIAPTNYWRRVT